MDKEDCDKSFEELFEEFEKEHNPWKKSALAWKIVLCIMYKSENLEL